MDANFDYVIVGAGSSGCVLATRLTESGGHRVLLLESGGPDSNRWIDIPVGVARLLADPDITWPFVTEPQRHLNGKPRDWLRGRVLGGSGSINGNVWVRGDPAEYDSWGIPGWNWQALRPYLDRIESDPLGDPALRGRDGPIRVTRLADFDPLSEAYLHACQQAGIPRVADYNDGSYHGVSYLQYSTRRGRRSSAAIEYLRPARDRRNLQIRTGAHVTRVLFEGKRAIGVEYRSGGELNTVRANAEVILCAGPMMSPALLERSGIGNGEILARHGIEVLQHLPGVGENLQDHPQVRLQFECTSPTTINDMMSSKLRLAKEAIRYWVSGTGLMSISSSTVVAYTRSRADVERTDLKVQIALLSGKARYGTSAADGLDPFSGFSIGAYVLLPRARGWVHIRDRDTQTLPAMDPRYLSHEADVQTLLDGLKVARRIAAQPALAPLIVREVRPGPDANNDDALLDHMRETVSTSWHQVGTCKLGTDAMAVVDPKLSVIGIERLRVIDSSVCPTVPASNTNAIALAIGEKGADLLLHSS